MEVLGGARTTEKGQKQDVEKRPDRLIVLGIAFVFAGGAALEIVDQAYDYFFPNQSLIPYYLVELLVLILLLWQAQSRIGNLYKQWVKEHRERQQKG